MDSDKDSQPKEKLVLAEEQRDDGLPTPETITNLPAGVQSLLGRPRLLSHENPNRYDALHKEVAAAIQPRDLFE